MQPTGGDDSLLAGRYRLRGLLGRGGMAEVYDGFDDRLARPVAVKILRRDRGDDPGREERFSREARSAARLSHPGVVAVYDSGVDRGRPFLVMERLPGATLADRIRSGPVDQRWLATIADDILGALGAAHAIGLVHRDVKPANILLTDDGRAKIADFGIAKTYGDARAGDAAGDLTATGLVLGTVAYLSPEQIQGGPASPRSDIYGMGVVLYEALTGRKPFPGANPVAQAHAAIEGRGEDVATLRPDVNPALAAVVRRAMARRPEDRYPSTQAMRVALAATGLVDPSSIVGGVATTNVLPRVQAPIRADAAATTVLPPAPPRSRQRERPPPPPPRRGVAAAVIAVTLVVLVAIAAVAYAVYRHDHPSLATSPTTAVHTATTRSPTSKPAKSTTTTGSTTTTTAPSPTTTIDPLIAKLDRYATVLKANGKPGPAAIAAGLKRVAAAEPGPGAAAIATQVLQSAADLYQSGSLTHYQYDRVDALLAQAGASSPTTTTTTTTSTTTTSTTTTTAPTTTTTKGT